MLSKRIKNIIKKVMVSLVLVCTLTTGLFTINTYARSGINPFQVSQSSITYQQKESKGKILIYHTHNNEDYIDTNIIEMGKDLATKLEKKGYIVEHITEDFEGNNYNNAYFKSREYLKGLDLGDYELVIDYHRDAISHPNTVKINDVDVAKGMLVYSESSKFYGHSKAIGGDINDSMDKFSLELMRNDWSYDSGIADFNSDLNDNIILFEAGNNSNKELHIRRLNTYFASSIDTYIKNNLTNN